MEIGQFGRPRTDPLDLSHAHDAPKPNEKPNEQQRAWQVVRQRPQQMLLGTLRLSK